MNINLIPDASVAAAPAGFVAAVEAAASIYEQDFSGNYTVNIAYGWGTYDNRIDSALTGSIDSLGDVINSESVSYATVKTLLAANATLSDQQTADASLPASSLNLPGDANDFFVSSAQEKALGVYSGSASSIDGAMGFGTDSYDWVGLALTELAHAFGWLNDYYTDEPTIADLFRFSSSGQRDWVGGLSEYFSIDGGATDLDTFATSFDYTLFTGPENDVLHTPATIETTNLSSLDVEALNVIGFTGSASSGGGLTILLSQVANNTAFVNNTDGAWDTVEGSNGTVVLTSALAGVYGGGDTVYFAAGIGDVATLYNSGGAWDGVYGYYGVVELNGVMSTVYGGGDTVYFASGTGNVAALFDGDGAWGGVYGSNGVVELNSVMSAVYGGGDSIDFASGTGNVAALFNSGGAWDGVYGSNGVVELNSVMATVAGGGDTIYFASGTGNVAALFNSGGAWDGVYGSNGVVELNSVTSTVYGGGDTVYFVSGAGNAAALFNSGGAWDGVYGSNGVVELNGVMAAVNGGGDTVYFDGGQNAVSASGSQENFVFEPAFGSDTISGFNSSDTIQFSVSEFPNWNALAESMAQSGSNTLIILNTYETVTLVNVAMSSLSQAQFSFH